MTIGPKLDPRTALRDLLSAMRTELIGWLTRDRLEGGLLASLANASTAPASAASLPVGEASATTRSVASGDGTTNPLMSTRDRRRHDR